MPAYLVLVLALLAPRLDPAQQARYDRALQRYDAGQTVEAAALLESLAVDTNLAHLTFEAGQVRFAAGHVAHAWRHYQAYLQRRDLSADDREIAEGRAEKAAAALRPIEVRVTPASAAASVVAVHLGDDRPELASPVREGVAELRLDPGPWDLKVEAPGHQPLRHHLDVIATGPTLVVPLTLEPVAPPPSPPAVDPAAPHRAAELRRGRTETIIGAVTLPIGLAALGGFVAVVGLRQSTRAEFEALRREAVGCDVRDQLHDIQTRARQETGAMLALGIGAGALLTTGAVLLVRGQRRLSRARLALDLRPGHAGLALSGAF